VQYGYPINLARKLEYSYQFCSWETLFTLRTHLISQAFTSFALKIDCPDTNMIYLIFM